ncbi:MAG: hypothetical protein QM323_05275, partial [Acidobacteriota bacterium]|nr:hypothetical protein [Acidobacteriota bacterium]
MQPRLRFLPISIFSVILGLSGYSIASQRVFAGQGWSAARAGGRPEKNKAHEEGEAAPEKKKNGGEPPGRGGP